MANYLDELNPVQQQAVTQTDGAVLVVAGPGSGKTRVLTYRIAHIIESGVAPWEILSLTFTNKAAREMKERLEKVVGERGNRVWAGTFHAIFARILRNEATLIGFPSSFTIYDSDDSRSLIRNIVKELNLNKEHYGESAVLSRISSAKSNLLPARAYAENMPLREEDKIAKRPELYRIYDEYAKRCKRAGAMDFDDLLLQTFFLFQQHPETCQKYQQRFKYILVDEFQDTNYLQYAILKKLALYPNSPQNLCAVGDDAQSIYAFRGATIENILQFGKDFPNLQTFKLEQNYRSTTHIVEAANEIISFNRRQIQKKIWTEKTDAQTIKLIKTLSDQEESKRVADLILEHKNRFHLKNHEIAILYRTNSQSRPFEESLRRVNVPYRVFGGTSFYQRKEVKDVIAYLRLIVNQNDDEALRRIINYPRRGIGDSTLDKIAKMAAERVQTLWETLPQYEGTARERNALQVFISTMKAFIDRSKKGDAYEITNFVVKQSGLMDMLKQDTSLEGLGRIENVSALLNAIAEFVENDELIDEITTPDKSLTTYLQNIALVSDSDNKKDDDDKVTLMSVHSAKGLEFKSVFVVGMEENLFPSFMSLDTPEGLDEERRLFYVAVTRAQDFLTLTFAASRYRFGQLKYCDPSRFLEEIGAQHIEATGSVGAGMGNSRMRERDPDESLSRVSGGVIRRNVGSAKTIVSSVDPATFKPSPMEKIEVGMKILHLKFGEGEIKQLDGAKDNRIATIHFKDVSDQPTKKIMLRFAKLQIL
ncbi:MAG: hypothetical protein RL757_2646 [Bacteroidota bacterium]|jgi:DNA helicase-2/ATP-dependent DNA helicase PcrA